METKQNLKECQDKSCDRQFKPYFSTDKYCSYSCAARNSKKALNRTSIKNSAPIRRRSVKGQALDREYSKINKEFLSLPENRYCPVTCGKTTEVHHKLGRKGYADDWARQMGIPLIIDVRFFLAVSHDGHVKIEKESDWAIKMGYSLLRTVTRNGKASE